MEIDLLYVPTKDLEEARRIGRTLVEEQLAGCVNIIPVLHSIYRWENALTEDSEALLLVKTPRALTAKTSERIRSLHTYQVPCIAVLPTDMNADYSKWLAAATGMSL